MTMTPVSQIKLEILSFIKTFFFFFSVSIKSEPIQILSDPDPLCFLTTLLYTI